ncbi:MAG: hypothetical protein H6613_01995 [Ignavibacteriales bacterium]|nr:hypothetical protein [Ignavibacteriales bacterium]
MNSNFLNPGTNTLKINSLPTEATINTCIFDWTEIEYPRYLIPIDNTLNFSFPFVENTFERIIKIQNVSVDNYAIWQYGNSYKKYITNKNNSEIIIGDTISSKDKFAYSDESKILTPKIYYYKNNFKI